MNVLVIGSINMDLVLSVKEIVKPGETTTEYFVYDEFRWKRARIKRLLAAFRCGCFFYRKCWYR